LVLFKRGGEERDVGVYARAGDADVEVAGEIGYEGCEAFFETFLVAYVDAGMVSWDLGGGGEGRVLVVFCLDAETRGDGEEGFRGFDYVEDGDVCSCFCETFCES
jgi:hypothetical protein